MSLGVNLLTALAKDAAKFLDDGYDIEIIETHHNHKLDAPSGTALTLAKAINDVRGDALNFVYGRHAAKQRRSPDEIKSAFTPCAEAPSWANTKCFSSARAKS